MAAQNPPHPEQQISMSDGADSLTARPGIVCVLRSLMRLMAPETKKGHARSRLTWPLSYGPGSVSAARSLSCAA